MNGECKTYRLNEPMTWGEFMRMPDEHKVTYIKLIRQKWNAPDSQMANMFGVNQVTVSKEFQRLGHASGQRSGRTKWDKEGFLAWVHGIPAEAIEETVEEPVEDVEEVKTAPVICCLPKNGEMRFEGCADEILNTLHSILGASSVTLNVWWQLDEFKVMEAEHG